MNNAKSPPFAPVPVELLGGLYSEASPESQPLGSSPRVINCDFILGSAFQRPGKKSVFYYEGLFIEKITNFAASIAGAHAPNENPWSNPTNAQLGIPGTSASVALNHGGGGGGGGLAAFCDAHDADGNNTQTANLNLTSTVKDYGIFLGASDGLQTASSSITGDVGTWTDPPGVTSSTSSLTKNGIVNGGTTLTPAYHFVTGNPAFQDICCLIGLFPIVAGQTPVANVVASVSGAWNTNQVIGGGTGVVLAGRTLFMTQASSNLPGATANSIASVTDNHGNVWFRVDEVEVHNFDPIGGGHWGTFTSLWMCPNPVVASDYTFTITNGAGSFFAGSQLIILAVTNLTGLVSEPYSQILHTINYPFSLPSTVVPLGFQVEIDGHQTSTNADAIVTASLVLPSLAGSPSFSGQLPASDGSLILATPIENWNLALTADTFNNPNFGINVVASAAAGSDVSFFINAVRIKVWVTPSPPPSFNYLKTFAQDAGEILNLVLGSDGNIYQEDAVNNPGVLEAVYTEVQPNSFAQSATVDDREFIAISDLLKGTDIPLTYTPPNFDRLTQVGPGAAPTCGTSSSGAAIVSITQNPQVPLTVSPHAFLLVSDSPSDHGDFGTPATPGNVLTLEFPASQSVPAYLAVGDNIVLSGFPTINGNVVNNDPSGATAPPFYTIASIGSLPPGQQSYAAITVTVPFTTFFAEMTPAGCKIQATKATMTTAVQVPNLEVGGQFQPTGTGGAPPAGYDNTWTVTKTPNASQLQITSTVLNGNIATYGFNLISGTNPAAGQSVTVTLTLNGNGIFNVVNAVISAAGAGSFSIPMTGPNVASAAETGAGIIFGTIFVFDAFTIVGNKFGGSVVTAGTISAGVRKCCYSFLTRNGFLSQPSPIATFDVINGASNIQISNLLTGPDNVIARVIHLTAANGDQFYNIPVDVTVLDNGANVISKSTWVNDNISTQATLSFADGVLLGADEIDIEGNNLFECGELGSCVMLVPFAQRLWAIGEQNKITNLLNYSFDGGIQVVRSTGGTVTGTYPAGWTVDPTNGSGVSVVASPIFGSALQILNASGSLQAIYGMITQNAFQDEFQVPIIFASTTYSVRVTCSVPGGPTTGNLVVDLYSPSLGRALGTFTLALSTVGTSMGIFTGTMLTTELAPVPNDLLIRIYATNLPNGQQINIDRIEPFPTEEPNLNNQIIGSYKNEFEQFDRLTGVIQTNQQNSQPVKSAFVLFNTLNVAKSNSTIGVNDNNTTEPSGWNIPRTISQAVGALGPYAITTGIDEPNAGEEWSIVAARSGLFLFQGTQPIKLSEEIQSVWGQINSAYAYTTVVKNDVANRRILVFVPLNELDAAGNSPVWLPKGVIQNGTNPTTPNVILELNYKQLNTAGALAESVGIHRSYSGKMVASDIVRKWSIWTIVSPAAAFLTRDDDSSPLFVGNSQATGKIYELVDNLLEDDGEAIEQRYMTAGFVPTETGQGMQIGVTRFTFEYMTLTIDGNGDLEITIYPNTVDSPYVSDLLPNLTLPASTNGDVEVPVNETASRLFVEFRSNEVGAGFNISRIIMALTKDPWSPVRGVNN